MELKKTWGDNAARTQAACHGGEGSALITNFSGGVIVDPRRGELIVYGKMSVKKGSKGRGVQLESNFYSRGQKEERLKEERRP